MEDFGGGLREPGSTTASNTDRKYRENMAEISQVSDDPVMKTIASPDHQASAPNKVKSLEPVDDHVDLNETNSSTTSTIKTGDDENNLDGDDTQTQNMGTTNASSTGESKFWDECVKDNETWLTEESSVDSEESKDMVIKSETLRAFFRKKASVAKTKKQMKLDAEKQKVEEEEKSKKIKKAIGKQNQNQSNDNGNKSESKEHNASKTYATVTKEEDKQNSGKFSLIMRFEKNLKECAKKNKKLTEKEYDHANQRWKTQPREPSSVAIVQAANHFGLLDKNADLNKELGITESVGRGPIRNRTDKNVFNLTFKARQKLNFDAIFKKQKDSKTFEYIVGMEDGWSKGNVITGKVEECMTDMWSASIIGLRGKENKGEKVFVQFWGITPDVDLAALKRKICEEYEAEHADEGPAQEADMTNTSGVRHFCQNTSIYKTKNQRQHDKSEEEYMTKHMSNLVRQKGGELRKYFLNGMATGGFDTRIEADEVKYLKESYVVVDKKGEEVTIRVNHKFQNIARENINKTGLTVDDLKKLKTEAENLGHVEARDQFTSEWEKELKTAFINETQFLQGCADAALAEARDKAKKKFAADYPGIDEKNKEEREAIANEFKEAMHACQVVVMNNILPHYPTGTDEAGNLDFEKLLKTEKLTDGIFATAKKCWEFKDKLNILKETAEQAIIKTIDEEPDADWKKLIKDIRSKALKEATNLDGNVTIAEWERIVWELRKKTQKSGYENSHQSATFSRLDSYKGKTEAFVINSLMRTDPVNLSPAELLVIFGYHRELNMFEKNEEMKKMRAKVGIDEEDDITISLATKQDQWYALWTAIRKKNLEQTLIYGERTSINSLLIRLGRKAIGIPIEGEEKQVSDYTTALGYVMQNNIAVSSTSK